MFKRLGSFAGWNFLGNTSFALVNDGLNILLNLFGGTAANAARGIAYQVRIAATSFINNIQIATNPQIVKLYAQDKKDEVFNIIFISSKVSFYILLIICLPTVLYVKPLLKLWLVIVPELSESFVQLILLFLLVRVFHGALDSLFKATGKIKKYQIVDGLILLLTIPISYILLKQGMPLNTVFIVMIVIETVNLFVILRIAKNIGQINILIYIKRVLFPCLSTFLISGTLSYIISYCSVNNLFMLILHIGSSMSVCFISIWLLGLTNVEKTYLKNFIRNNKKFRILK
jgi:Na+-driven multidrug efflux pump